MKKLALLALMAITMLAARPVKHDNPLPQCEPCPWVR